MYFCFEHHVAESLPKTHFVKSGKDMKKELKIFDNPRNVQRLLIGFYLSLAMLLASEFFIHKHASYPWENFFGFFGVYGFVSCVLLIFLAKGLRLIVMRKEDYYDT